MINFYKRAYEIKHQAGIFLAIAVVASLFLLTSCSMPKIAAIPEQDSDILTGEIGADRVVTLSDESKTFTCSGTYKVVKNTVSCEGKEGELILNSGMDLWRPDSLVLVTLPYQMKDIPTL